MDPRSNLSQPFSATEPERADLDPEPEPEPVVPGPVQRKAKASNWVNVALGAAVIVAVAGVSFAAGRLTAPAASAAGLNGQTGGRQFPGGNGYFPGGAGQGQPGGDRGGFGGGLSLTGTVDSVSGSTLTLKLANGNTIQVSLSDATTYHAQAAATSSDVTTGKTVIVQVQGFRPDGNGTGTTGGGSTATSVTVVP